jgi:hypothetical protein
MDKICSSETSNFLGIALFNNPEERKLSLLPNSLGCLLGLLYGIRRKRSIRTKRWALFELHGIIFQNIILFIVTIVRPSNLTRHSLFLVFSKEMRNYIFDEC